MSSAHTVFTVSAFFAHSCSLPPVDEHTDLLTSIHRSIDRSIDIAAKVGLTGYVTKQSGCSHYKLYKKGDGWTAAMFERGREAYLRYGAGPLKDKILLTGHNLMERALMYAQLTSSATSAPSIGHLVNILWAMLQSGLYAPATNWVQPRGGEGLDYTRASALARGPSTATPTQPLSLIPCASSLGLTSRTLNPSPTSWPPCVMAPSPPTPCPPSKPLMSSRQMKE